MKAAKLVSVRLDEEDLKIIDEAASVLDYRKRSDYIQAAVRLMAWAIKNSQQLKILRFYPNYGDVVDKFELTYCRAGRRS